MKHLNREPVRKVEQWLGLALAEAQWNQLERFADWLREEAIGAGGLGPHEADRIWERHLADSMAFACGWAECKAPARLLDVGAGVGLPGIPLAILWPDTMVTLLDRAGRRIDLAGRAVRVLGLRNIEVRQGDVFAEPRLWESAVFRAVLTPERAMQAADTVLRQSGMAVIGLRGRSRLTTEFGAKTPINRPIRMVDIPSEVLDAPASFLIMGGCEH